MICVHGVNLAGSLASEGEVLWSDLERRGYAPLTAKNHLRVLAHLSRWLSEAKLTPDQLSSERVAQFVARRREIGYRSYVSARGVEPVLSCLRSAGVVPAAGPRLIDESPLGRLLEKYEAFLVRERELVQRTVRWYGRVAREFMAPRGARALRMGQVVAQDVTAFVLREARAVSVGVAKLKVSALRSFLGYAFAEGLLTHDLRAAAPAIAGWRLAGLPKALPRDVPRRLLQACDRRTACGRRDCAVLVLMFRLALRACEIAALELDDVDWASAEVLIRGKGRRKDRLPLPQDVGHAIASYLQRGRPATSSRTLFILARAPRRAITASAVKAVVLRAATKAGLPAIGAHRLRHTAATEMLRQGATLPQIAQALRHRSVNTTAIYAKVDRTALRDLARPWPQSAQ